MIRYFETESLRSTAEFNTALQINSAVLSLVAQSCPTLCDPMDWHPPGSSLCGDSPGKNTGVGCHVCLQGSSQPRDWTQVSHTAGLPHQPGGKPKNTGGCSLSFSRGSSWPRNWTGVSCIAGGFFTGWDTRKAQINHASIFKKNNLTKDILRKREKRPH